MERFPADQLKEATSQGDGAEARPGQSLAAPRAGVGDLRIGRGASPLEGGAQPRQGSHGSLPPTLEEPLRKLMEGNERFVAGRTLHPRQSPDRIAEVAAAQRPIAVVVGCSDSRVPPEIIFDQGLGDLFVVRAAGNSVGPLELGSVAFAVDRLGANLVIVLGHDRCGAVESALETVLCGSAPAAHLAEIIHHLRPAAESAIHAGGDQLLENAVVANIRRVVRFLRSSEPILAHRVRQGSLAMYAARYNMDTGAVVLLPE